jgi:hypothetical protein
MIHYLNTLPGKKRKVVADLGCGRAEINQYFKENHRFEFHNFDHHSDNDLVISRDIKHIPLDDLSILPYYLWQGGGAIVKNTYKKHIAFWTRVYAFNCRTIQTMEQRVR